MNTIDLSETNRNLCTRCVMDSTDPDIKFNSAGRCNHCVEAERKLKSSIIGLNPIIKSSEFKKLIERIKSEGKKKQYDCIIGLSGGVDSSYAAYLVKQLGLRPLAVHLDNGWNSEISMKNIENIVKKLNFDLYTYVIDWEEFKDLQLSFLKASTPDCEILTDHAIVSILYKIAKKQKVRFILPATNFNTESILPRAWSHGHSDWRYIKSVHKQFGTKKIKTYPHRSLIDIIIYKKINGIKWIDILDYYDYKKNDAITILENELDWRNYGGKHYESIFTRFFQGHILPTKFRFDKRKAHLSSLIISNQISREDALRELENKPYPNPELLAEDTEYFINKFGLSENEFNEIMGAKAKTYWDYPSYEKSFVWSRVIKFGKKYSD